MLDLDEFKLNIVMDTTTKVKYIAPLVTTKGSLLGVVPSGLVL
jgi:hypothetical protein